MPGHPQGRRFGLLVDLLVHEMAEAALVRHVLGAREQGGVALLADPRAVVELDAQGREQGDFAVLQGQDRAGEAGQGRGIASAEKFPFAQANQQGRLAAGHHQATRHRRPDDGQGIGPLELGQHQLHRLQQQAATGDAALVLQGSQLAGEQVGDHLRIGVGAEDNALGLELLAQAAVVLDDAVLNHGHLAAAIEVGVGIALLGLAVGGPTGVADAAVARGAHGLEAGREVDELALGPQAGELAWFALGATGRGLKGGLNRGQACRVVAAVFQLAQALEQQGGSLPRTDHRNDAAHTDREGTKKPGLGRA